MDYIADRTKSIDASAIRKIWEMAATMTDPVDFSIGQPDFHASAALKAAAIEAIQADQDTYTLTAGVSSFRQALAAKISHQFGWSDPQILVTAGLSGALLLALMATANPQDEVLIPDPYFVSYRHLTNLVGAKPVYIDTYPDFQLRPELIAAHITKNTKLLMLNSPANPTGQVSSPEQLMAIAEIAREHRLLVVSDEIYADFAYDQPCPSIASYYQNTLVLRGYSKSCGVPGWRLGYVAMPEHLTGVFEKMATLQQYTFVCAPHPFQLAAQATLDCDLSGQIDNYRRKRDLIYDGLKGSFDLVRPGGAFYCFVPAPGPSATDFVTQAIKNNVLVIPGSVFSQKDTHFRLSYATSDERIKTGAQRLCKLADQVA